MMKQIYPLIISVLFSFNLYAQVAISEDGSSSDASAMLEIKSTSKGLLIPRLSEPQIESIENPANGLLVFCTTNNKFYTYLSGDGVWKDLSFGGELWFCGQDLVDSRDDQSYATVFIGNKCWMAENLNIGTRIDGGNDMANNSIIEKYCYNNNDYYCNTRGGLYQWDEMMQYTTVESTQGICPDGWFLPSDEEWKELEMALGMSQSEADNQNFRGTNQGLQMKSTSGWNSNGNGTNTSGFNALPNGFYSYLNLNFRNYGYIAFFWTSTKLVENENLNWFHTLWYNNDKIARWGSPDLEGYSVRCIKN